MNFPLRDWCDPARGPSGRSGGERALRELKWALTTFETPQPVAVDLAGVARLDADFVIGFFGGLADDWPESYFGRHSIVIVGADADVARDLRATLKRLGLAFPIAEQTQK